MDNAIAGCIGGVIATILVGGTVLLWFMLYNRTSIFKSLESSDVREAGALMLGANITIMKNKVYGIRCLSGRDTDNFYGSHLVCVGISSIAY